MAEAARFAHHMSDEDALMWNIEKDPVLRSTILAVALFDSVPDWERLRRRIDRTTCFIPRLRQRVVSPPFRIAPPRWTAEPTFDLDFHLRRVRLAGPERCALLDALQPIATASFDRARPLWEFTLFEGLDGPDGERAAFAMKVHHSVTDGVGGMELLAHFVDLVPTPPNRRTTTCRPHSRPMTRGCSTSCGTRSRTTGAARSGSRRIPAGVAHAAESALRNPMGSARDVLRTTRSIARALAPATHPMSPIMLRRGLGRRLEAFDVSLDELRRVAKATDASLNDVFVAAVVGGVRRYHERHGAAPIELRMTLPINLRQGDDDAGGNRFAPARFPVPTSIDDPRERIAALGALIREWRAEPALQMTSTLAGDPQPAADRDDDRVVRRHAQVLRLRDVEHPRRAGTRIRRRRPRRAAVRIRPAGGRGVQRRADLALRHLLHRRRDRHRRRARSGDPARLSARGFDEVLALA